MSLIYKGLIWLFCFFLLVIFFGLCLVFLSFFLFRFFHRRLLNFLTELSVSVSVSRVVTFFATSRNSWGWWQINSNFKDDFSHLGVVAKEEQVKVVELSQFFHLIPGQLREVPAKYEWAFLSPEWTPGFKPSKSTCKKWSNELLEYLEAFVAELLFPPTACTERLLGRGRCCRSIHCDISLWLRQKNWLVSLGAPADCFCICCLTSLSRVSAQCREYHTQGTLERELNCYGKTAEQVKKLNLYRMEAMHFHQTKRQELAICLLCPCKET